MPILTNLNPVTAYTASVVTDGTILTNGLGNQLTSLQLTSSFAGTSSFSITSSISVTSFYDVSSSFASQSVSASWSKNTLSSSYLSGSTGNVYVGGVFYNTSSTNYNTVDFSSDGTLFAQLGRNDQSGTEATLILSDAFTHKYSGRGTSFLNVSLDAATTVFDIDSKGANAPTEMTLIGYMAPTLYLNEVVDGAGTHDVNIKVDGASGINSDPTNRKGRSLIISAEPNEGNAGDGGNVVLVSGAGDTGQASGSIVLSGSVICNDNITAHSFIGTLDTGAGTIGTDGTNTICSAPLAVPNGIWDKANSVQVASFDGLHFLNDKHENVMIDFTEYNFGVLNGSWQATSGGITGSITNAVTASVITPQTWSAISAASAVTWSAANNVYEDRKSLTVTGPTTMSLQNLYNGWSGVLKVKNGNTGSLLFVTPKPIVVNVGSGSLILSNISASVDVISFDYDGTDLMASVGNTFN